MAPAFDYLTQVLLYLLPGQAVFNGLPVNQQLLLSPNASSGSLLAVTEENAIYQASHQPHEAREHGVHSNVGFSRGHLLQ